LSRHEDSIPCNSLPIQEGDIAIRDEFEAGSVKCFSDEVDNGSIRWAADLEAGLFFELEDDVHRDAGGHGRSSRRVSESNVD
jgi:hypothetical protein